MNDSLNTTAGMCAVYGYHGTDKFLTPDNLDPDRNLYLTSNIRLAEAFGENVLFFKVEAENPYEIDWLGCSSSGGFFPEDNGLFDDFIRFVSDEDDSNAEYWRNNGICADRFADYVASKGYDLLIIHNILEMSGHSDMEYVVMKGCMVKDVSRVCRKGDSFTYKTSGYVM